MDDGGRTTRILGGVLAGLLLLGAGIGIGALIWSGDSSTTRTVAVAPQSNEAPDQGGDQAGLAPNGDVRVNIKVKITGAGPDGAAFSTRQGQPTNCTKDETYDDWDVADGGTQPLGMTAKFDGGACNYQPSVIHENTFNATVNDGAGQLYVKVLAVKAPGPVARYTYVKVPECRGWSGGWSCSAGKGTALDPEFTITKG